LSRQKFDLRKKSKMPIELNIGGVEGGGVRLEEKKGGEENRGKEYNTFREKKG
jgi:hypothetical protein